MPRDSPTGDLQSKCQFPESISSLIHSFNRKQSNFYQAQGTVVRTEIMILSRVDMVIGIMEFMNYWESQHTD